MTVLALDTATNCGWALGSESGGKPTCGVWNLPENGLDRAMVALRDNVMWACKSSGVKTLVYEATLQKVDRFHGRRVNEVLLMLQAVAREAAFRNGCDIRGYATNTWRKTFLGNGSLITEEAKRAALHRCKILGWPTETHDAAEACGLLYHHLSTTVQTWRP